jgi:hypothetical protein
VRGVPRAAALVATLVVALVLPSAAGAARYRRCPENPNILCTTVRVPLDRDRPRAGSVSLHVQRWRGLGRRRPNALVLLAGGPGQSATEAFAEGFVRVLPGGLAPQRKPVPCVHVGALGLTRQG